MSRYRIGAIGGPIIGGMVHRLSEAQPEAQITTHASYYVDELASMVLAGKLDFAQVGVCGDAMPVGGVRPGLADHRGRRRSAC